jgi:Winged helix-turn helix
LRQGALANGFRRELWSLPRVAPVLERISGVRYHPGHVWKLLGARRWSAQKPQKQAQERRADQVAYGKTVRWPALKNAADQRAWIFFQEETAFTPATLDPPEVGAARRDTGPEAPRESRDQDLGSGGARLSRGGPEDTLLRSPQARPF